MEHPLIGNISSLTLDELTTKVNELQKKLSIAQRSGNGYLTNQVRMALESYQTQYQSRLREAWQQQGGNNYNDRISVE
jgi:hypothetical protein